MFFRVGKGLSSKLLKYEHGIIYVELEVRTKWKKTIDSAAWLIANSWKEENPEFAEAVAAKIYVVDLSLIHI